MRMSRPQLPGSRQRRGGVLGDRRQPARARNAGSLYPDRTGIPERRNRLRPSRHDRPRPRCWLPVHRLHGNEADLDASDFIQYMLHDFEVRVVAALVEGFRDGAKFAGPRTWRLRWANRSSCSKSAAPPREPQQREATPRR